MGNLFNGFDLESTSGTSLVKPLEELKDVNSMNFVRKDFARAITHSGIFHADEVFATAALFFIGKSASVARVSEVGKVDERAIVYDIGDGEYDHHNVKKYRDPSDPNSIYSSFGLIWKDYAVEIVEEIVRPETTSEIDIDKVCKIVDDTLVRSIDRIDNGIVDNDGVFSVSKMISDYNSSWNEDNSITIQNENFKTAVGVAYNIIYNTIKRAVNSVSAIPIIMNALDNNTIINGQILLLDKFCPYESLIIEASNNPESEYYQKARQIKFVVFPSNRGGYMVMTISDGHGGFRHNITTTLIPEQKFRHANGYCAATNTVQSAIRLCEKSLEEA